MLVVPPPPQSIISRATGVDVADAFSTTLYTGNATDDRDITNGVNISANGGMVWIKNRDAADNHIIVDTERGATKYLSANATTAETTDTNMVQAFNVNGFEIGTGAEVNTNTEDYVSWTFRKAAGFFDVVTYTGNGSNRTISHSLGAVPGMIIVKRTDSAESWMVYHRGNTAAPETDYLELEGTGATFDSAVHWNDTAPTDAVFSVGTHAAVNANTGSFVAFLFGHDTDGIIQCGSYTGTGSSGNAVSLGWQPQFVMTRYSSSGGNWNMNDSARGVSEELLANSSFQEQTNAQMTFGSDGFTLSGSSGDYNASSGEYIYVAIKAE